MSTSKNKLYRILAVICVGLVVCGVKLWLDASASPSVIFRNRTDANESTNLTAEMSDSMAATTAAFQTTEPAAAIVESNHIPIYLCGAVLYPGIYEIDSGTYLYEVIETAGGLLPEAAAEYMNLVYCISEAVSIYIPTEDEMKSFLEGKEIASSEYLRNGLIQGIWGTGSGQNDPTGDTSLPKPPDLININTAEQAQLESLPGVGEATAKAIISYREKNGGFAAIEDIMNVSGIKEGRFEALREFITV